MSEPRTTIIPRAKKTPLPPIQPGVNTFEPLMLPEAFRGAVDDIGERMQCPLDYPAIGYTVTLSAVAGRKIRIAPKAYDDWTVTPNLWGAIVGPPGVMKTHSLVAPLRPLHLIEDQERKRHEIAQGEFDAMRAVLVEQKKVSAQRIRKQLQDGGNARDIAREFADESLQAPERLRLITNDSTVEKVGELLAANPNGILIFRDELTGFLRSMEKEGQESARAFYLECWNGDGRFTFDRIGRGTVEIEAACVSILGGIQPGPLMEYVRRTYRGGIADDGLLQRFQMVTWPDISPDWHNVDRAPNDRALTQANQVYERIHSMSGCTTLHLTPEAQAMFDTWRHGLEAKLRGDDEASIMQAHLAKYRSLVPSLAGLIHVADNPSLGPIGESALTRALAWSEYLESHARRVYAPAILPAIPAGHALLAKLKANKLPGEFTAREVYFKGWTNLTSPDEVANAARLLVDHGYLAAFDVDTSGRPKTIYRVVA